jgi:hypothetical protein
MENLKAETPKNWSKKDVDEFDKHITMSESPNQVTRIEGRLNFEKFKLRFSKEELDEMWELIKDN